MISSRATAPESSKALRAALTSAFPAVTFRVKLSRGTAYGYCDVSWTDGPSAEAVNEVAGRFQGQGFNSSDDSTYQIENKLADGRQTGLRGVSCQRTISASLARRCVAQIAAFFGGVESVPVVFDSAHGYDAPAGMTTPRPDIRQDWYSLIHQAAADRSRFVRQGVPS